MFDDNLTDPIEKIIPDKRDKIFDNGFDESEKNSDNVTLSIDPCFESRLLENTLDEKLIYDKFEDLMTTSIYDKYAILDENGSPIKLTKSQINEIYSFVITSLPSTPRIELFSIISSYFCILPNKLYESISNKYKSELVSALKSRGFLDNSPSLF